MCCSKLDRLSQPKKQLLNRKEIFFLQQNLESNKSDKMEKRMFFFLQKFSKLENHFGSAGSAGFSDCPAWCRRCKTCSPSSLTPSPAPRTNILGKTFQPSLIFAGNGCEPAQRGENWKLGRFLTLLKNIRLDWRGLASPANIRVG
jgi:hypothetical protein